MPLKDTFDPSHLTFLFAQPFNPDLTTSGVLTWLNLADIAYFGSLPPSRTIRITTTYRINNVPVGVTRTVNIASVNGAEGEDGTPLPPQTDDAAVEIPTAAYVLDKWRINPASGETSSGQVITFGIAITSTGTLTITKMPLRDTFVEDHLTFLFAQPFDPDLRTSGILTWTDLASASRFGEMPPGRSIRLTTTFLVDNIPENVSITTNTVTVDGAEGADGIPLPPQSDDADVHFPTPTPTPPPDPPPDPGPPDDPNTPTDSDDDDDDGNRNAPPPSEDPSGVPTPTPTPPAGANLTLPVNLLPETGFSASSSQVGWPLIVVLVLSVFIGWGIHRIYRE